MTAAQPVPDFSCNVEAVRATADRLGLVLDELKHFGTRDDAWAAALASGTIRKALDEFEDDSSDQREKVTGSVEALASMLSSLVTAVQDVDRALHGSLPDTQPQGPLGQQPNPTPAARPPR